MSQWHFEIVFAEDLTAIVGGKVTNGEVVQDFKAPWTDEPGLERWLSTETERECPKGHVLWHHYSETDDACSLCCCEIAPQ